MRNAFSFMAVFAVGTLTGAAASALYLKKKYDAIIKAKEETYYGRMERSNKNDSVNPEETVRDERHDVEQKDNVNTYQSLINKCEYSNYATELEREESGMSKPYVIDPDEFGTLDYTIVSLTYYSDDIVADSFTDKIMRNPYETLGDFKDHIGEYEDDAVYVRDDRLKRDYEVLLDDRTYKEVVDE